MKLFGAYESPSSFSRAVMASGDLLSWFLVPRRPRCRLPIAPEHINKLLVLRLDGIGDNVCSWPALEKLRQTLPGTRISLAVGPWVAPLYRECPWIDEIIEWNSGLFGLFRGKGLGGLPRDIGFSRTLRSRGFDVGIDLRGDVLSISLLWLIAPLVRVAHVARGGARLLTDPLRPRNVAEAQRTYDVAQAVVGLPPEMVPRIKDWARPEALARASQRLIAIGWNGLVPTVALCPLALWPWRLWPKERFLALARKLKKELGLQIIWFLDNPNKTGEYASGDPVFCGPIDEVAAALSQCRLAVANDSGLLHLAVAAGCKTVQLFGPGEASRFAHTGEGLVLLHDTSCQRYPCVQRGDCGNLAEGWCLEKVSVDEVYNSCVRLLRK